MSQLEQMLADYARSALQRPRSTVLTGFNRPTTVVGGIVDVLAGKGISALRSVNFSAAIVRSNGCLGKAIRWPQT